MKSKCSCNFTYDSISKTLFSVITITGRNTDENHDELIARNSEIQKFRNEFGSIESKPRIA